MIRFLIAALVVAAAGSAVIGQDMPLSMFLIEGEGWRKAEGRPPEPVPFPKGLGWDSMTAVVYSPITGTYYVGRKDERAVYAIQGSSTHSLSPYCPLWRKPGQDTLAVMALEVDSRGCVYAATPNGLQIFDPTGRLCGVVPFPAKDDVVAMRWEGDAKDVLMVWIGDAKYIRKLKVK